jgi:hypothetical protein
MGNAARKKAIEKAIEKNTVGAEAYQQPPVSPQTLKEIAEVSDLVFELSRHTPFKQFQIRLLLGVLAPPFDETTLPRLFPKSSPEFVLQISKSLPTPIHVVDLILLLGRIWGTPDTTQVLWELHDNGNTELLNQSLKVYFPAEKEWDGLDGFEGFTTWASTNLDIAALRRGLDVIPGCGEEKQKIKKIVTESELETGQEWFAVSIRWWQLWKEYCGYDADENPEGKERRVMLRRSASNGIIAQRPNAIDNSDLEHEKYPGCLKKDLVEQEDFILLPCPAWMLLHSWYGGGPAFARQVIEIGKAKKLKIVDLHPIFVSFYSCSGETDSISKSSCVSSTMSSHSSLENLKSLGIRLLVGHLVAFFDFSLGIET